MSLYGILDLPLWQVVLAGLAMTHLTIASVTIFLHRSQAHRAVELHPIPAHLFRFWIWLTTGMVTREWVAVHRKHHVHCETEQDPHSPRFFGIRRVLTQGSELYRDAVADRRVVERYGHGTPDDWIERNLYSRFTWHGCALMLVADLALFGVYGLTLWAVQMLWIPVAAAGVVNGLGHYWGYRSFDTPDGSRNILAVGLLIGGEELHNNHHAFPASARLAQRWWEIDIGWQYIRLLSLLRLARIKRVAVRVQKVAPKRSVDLEILRAVVAGRMHVSRRFSRQVLRPVAREALCQGGRGCWHARRVVSLLGTERRLLDAEAQAQLHEVLSQSERLRLVYELREQLRQVWERRAPSQEDLLVRLQEWSERAEQTGIAVLARFACDLRALRLVQA